jgi:predicted DCC family thiol-disulfide oxidoreductase YuxK
VVQANLHPTKVDHVGKHIWFYDGECALCDRGVQFILRRDRAGRFRIAELQSDFARRELPRLGVDPAELAAGAADPRAFKTFYLIASYGTREERLLNRSRGVAFLLSQLGGGWGLYGRFLLLWPAWLLDPAYRFVNRVRYRWFGGKDHCAVPTPEQQARMIS